jgi:pimeloyl-ACP methyl ester carboxylesterase
VESVVAAGRRLEFEWVGDGSGQADAPTLVFLHEGLGCVAMWRGFPERVARETGCRALVYSRWGYGGSDPVTLPRPLTYMHDEGLVALPELLAALDVKSAVLLGHSDGASIAIIHAGSRDGAPRVRGLALLAPHVFCEDIAVESIAEARVAYETTDLRARLARYHGANVDGAFHGWNDAWLDPGFRRWNIEDLLPRVRVPILAIQGDADTYGTLAQLDAIERGCGGPFARLVLPGVGHDPARDAAEATATAVTSFLETLP